MKKIPLLVLSCFVALTGFAQPGVVRKETNSQGVVIFAEFRPDSTRSMTASQDLLRQIHAIQPDEEFKLTERKTDELGFTHLYFNQYYKGIRVAYSTYAVHGKNNMINTINGTARRVNW